MADYGDPVTTELVYEEDNPRTHCEGRFPVPNALGKRMPVGANDSSWPDAPPATADNTEGYIPG